MAIGDQMPIFSGMVPTYKEDFSNGLGKFVNTKHIWQRETVINGESQYYPDQSTLQAGDETVFINANNELVLRTIPTPSYLQNDAKVVINGYIITSIVSSNQIEVAGINYYDVVAQQNIIGIGPRRESSGLINICGVDMGYVSIQDTQTGANARHIITLSNPVPSNVTINDTNCRATIYRRQPHISGMVTTHNRISNNFSGFAQKFGRFGARIKSARGIGHFPAFWLWPDYEQGNGVTYPSVDKSSEKDIWEILGHAADISYHTLHQPGYDMRPNDVPLLPPYNGVDQWQKQHMQQFIESGVIDWSSGFHWVYLDWFTDNTFAWYAELTPNSGNIVEIANSRGAPPYVNGVIDESMLVFNNAIDSNWSVSTARWQTSSPIYTDQRSFPLDFCISDVCVEQFESVQIGGGNSGGETDPVEPIYTGTTVVGPPGGIEDVVVCLPTEESDRQGTVHEIEAKICYRPSNIPEDKIGIQWAHNFPTPPFQVSFVDGSDKQWHARIHLTTIDTTALPKTLQGRVTCGIYLIP